MKETIGVLHNRGRRREKEERKKGKKKEGKS